MSRFRLASERYDSLTHRIKIMNLLCLGDTSLFTPMQDSARKMIEEYARTQRNG